MKIFKNLVIAILIAVIAYFGYMTYQKSQKDIQAIETPQVVVLSKDEILTMNLPGENLEWLDQRGWVPSALLDAYYIYSDFDAEEDLVTISDGFDTIVYDMAYEQATLNGQEFSMDKPRVEDGMLWIPLDQMKDVFHLSYDINENTKTIFVKDNTLDYTLGNAEYEIDLLMSPGESRILDEISEKESLVITDYDEEYIRVMTADYQVGFVPSDVIVKTWEVKAEAESKKSPIERDQPVFLTWEIYGRGYDTDKIGPMRGVNVISPAWYALSDDSGNFSAKPSENYINWAKGRDYELWALVSNDFDVKRTNTFLHSTTARKHFISNLLAEYSHKGYEGINIDFENVYKEDKRQLTQFVAELTSAFRRENMVVSMDVTVMGGSDTWSKCYDRKALGHLVDYLAIMTYDEHWASSPISGSVSSYNWMKSNMEKIAQIVPSEKLLLGIPYYMRVWTEVPSRERANAMDVDSGVLNMPNAEKWIEEKDLHLIWDEDARQHYTGYIENGALKKIWFENATSIREKATLVNELKLGGAAVWRRGFETQDIWGVIDDAIKAR